MKRRVDVTFLSFTFSSCGRHRQNTDITDSTIGIYGASFPHQAPVSATFRVTANFSDVFFVAKLIVQHPPKESFRPALKDRWQNAAEDDQGEAAPPLPELSSNVNVDPEEYGGRTNWLQSLETVCVETGKDACVFPHVELAPNMTYILQVELDSSRCESRETVPVNVPLPEGVVGGEAEDGSTSEKTATEYRWRLEVFADGELDVGNDTMEADLETIVMRNWAKKAGQSLEERVESANAARGEWVEKGEQG